MKKRHKVFVSYHHANDQEYKNYFEDLFANLHRIVVSRSVQIGDIDPNNKVETIRRLIRDNYLRDSTVTVVLVGRETWKRKHVDWEISSSIRKTASNARSGLLGILLPSHANFGDKTYDPHIIPPRLHDNISCGFAKLFETVLTGDLPGVLIFIIADLLFFVSAVKTISDPLK